MNAEFQLCVFSFLQHDFVKNAQPCSILQKMITEAKEIQEAQKAEEQEADDDEVRDILIMALLSMSRSRCPPAHVG